MEKITKDINRNIIALNSTLKDVLDRLNKGIFGIVFVVSESGKLQGIFTDGDVRRALLDGAELSATVQEHMKKDFVFAKTGHCREEYISMLSEKIRHLPIVDDHGRLINFISWVEILRKPVTEPTLGGNELKYVTECIRSNWISSQGSFVRRFEKKFAEYYGVEHALTTSSGTTALHLALVALGIGPGDEVIIPDITFAACANVVIQTGARPVFVDVSPDHWTLDPNKLLNAITDRTRAIMAVHLYGHPCDMDRIRNIASQNKIYIIEDCAESIGAKYKEKLTGTLGDVACFSFFSNKVITTGEGGMVITNNPDLIEKMMILRDHGMSKNKKFWHLMVGYNYRMTNLQAAVGLAQMEQIDQFLRQRRIMAEFYEDNLKGIPGITLPPEMNWAYNIFWLYTILVDDRTLGVSRNDLMIALEREGIETRPYFYPLHVQPPYYDNSSDYTVSLSLSKRGLSLPSGNGLQLDEIQQVCMKIKKIIQHHKTINNYRPVYENELI